jgi:glycosyltransferase involved in cell wall biosynthesis
MVINNNIKVTVLMPVYNSKLFLNDAIESILNQTHNNFEFLIINDGSTDESDIIIRSFTDSRIKYINNEINQGIVTTLNEGVAISSGKYIARMDSDDISLPNRLEKQIAFLENNPDFKLCGSRAIAINNKGEKLYKLKRPTSFEHIKVFNFFRNAFIHPTVMAEANTLKNLKYSEAYLYAEDYMLFSQFAMNYRVANLNEYLLQYRIHEESITSKKNIEMVKSEVKTIKFLLSFLFDKVTEKQLLLHHSILRPQQEAFSAEDIHQHFLDIFQKNNEKRIFLQPILRKHLLKEWYKYLLINKIEMPLKSYLSSPLFILFQGFNPKHIFKLLFK